MPIVINRGQYKLPLSFIDLSFISYELQPILDKCRWIIANWWYWLYTTIDIEIEVQTIDPIIKS